MTIEDEGSGLFVKSFWMQHATFLLVSWSHYKQLCSIFAGKSMHLWCRGWGICRTLHVQKILAKQHEKHSMVEKPSCPPKNIWVCELSFGIFWNALGMVDSIQLIDLTMSPSLCCERSTRRGGFCASWNLSTSSIWFRNLNYISPDPSRL